MTGGLLGVARAELVGQWLFDEGSGDVARDTSENGNDGQVNNADWVAGQFGGALEFAGAASNVEVPHSPELSVQEFTLMAWVNVPDFTGGWQTLMTQNTAGPTRNYGLFINDGSGLIHYSFTSANGWNSFNAGTNVVNGEWRHIAATYDFETFTCYVDGEIDGETARDLEPDTAESPITIGSWEGGGWIQGAIDEVALFNHALSQEEVQGFMERGLSVQAVEPGGKLASIWSEIKTW